MVCWSCPKCGALNYAKGGCGCCGYNGEESISCIGHNTLHRG